VRASLADMEPRNDLAYTRNITSSNLTVTLVTATYKPRFYWVYSVAQHADQHPWENPEGEIEE